MIERGGRDRDDHVLRAGLGIGDVGVLEHLGPARAVIQHCFHDASLRPRTNGRASERGARVRLAKNAITTSGAMYGTAPSKLRLMSYPFACTTNDSAPAIAEEQAAGDRAPQRPSAEHHRGDRDDAVARRHVAREPRRVERQERAAEPTRRAAEQDGLAASLVDVDTRHVGCLWVLAHRPHLEPPASAEHEPPREHHDRYDEKADQSLTQYLAEHAGQVVEAGDRLGPAAARATGVSTGTT